MTEYELDAVVGADIPQPANTRSPQPSGAASSSKSAYRYSFPLLVLATVIGIAGAFAVWVNRQALNTSNWSSTSSQILENKQVQTALSAYLVHELLAKVDVAGDLQNVLPSSYSRFPVRPPPGCSSLPASSLRGCLPAPRCRRRCRFRPTSPRTRSC